MKTPSFFFVGLSYFSAGVTTLGSIYCAADGKWGWTVILMAFTVSNFLHARYVAQPDFAEQLRELNPHRK